MVGVLVDVPALDRVFDYTVPEGLEAALTPGTIVRVRLQGRPERGWVVRVGRRAGDGPTGDALKPIHKVTGRGPGPDLLALAEWAAHRWAGRRVHLLRTASPPRAVTALPAPRPAARPAARSAEGAGGGDGTVAEALARGGTTIVRHAPATDPVGMVREVVARLDGSGRRALIVAATDAMTRHLASGLRADGPAPAVVPREWAQAAAGAHVVGTRPAVWAPAADLGAVVVVDEHEEAHQQQQAPTWHARDVAVERARRAGVACLLLSAVPTLEALELGPLVAPSRDEERAGWPVVDVVDRREEPPGRGSLFTERLARLVRERTEGRVVCVLNRTGRSRLLACARCGELARCERCDAAVVEVEAGRLDCDRCGATRPRVCQSCGGATLKNLRLGVSRAREELEALVREPVGELTGTTGATPTTRVVVGTEAVLHRIGRAEVVAFLDLDQELLAPRYRAAEQALALLARAGRRLGGRRDGGRLVLQTRTPDHPVVQAALHGDPARLATVEADRRRLLRFPPAVALASIAGAGAEAFVAALPEGTDVRGPSDDRWLVTAPDHDALADLLAATPRPKQRLRVEVDPMRT